MQSIVAESSDGEHTSSSQNSSKCQATWQWFEREVVRRFQVKESRAFAFWLMMLVVTGSGVNIYLRTVIQLMPDFQYFVFQSGVLAFLPLAATVTFYKMMFTNHITPKMRSCWLMPRFFVMATLDSIEDLAVVVASNHASIAVQTLLPQGVLPLTMAFSVCLLKARFRLGQLFGAFVILAGVVFVVVPLFSQPSDGGDTSAFFGVVIFAANVPGALSSIWKQVSLQKLDMDVFYLNTIITLWQVVINFAISPLNALPAMGGTPLDQIPSQFRDGFSCLIGTDRLVQQYPDCAHVWWRWILFVTCVFLFNWSILQIVKVGSASFMYVASALTLPLTNVMATSSLIMGGSQFTSSITPWDLCALASTVIGLLIYGFSGGSDESGADTDDKTEPQVAEGVMATSEQIASDDESDADSESDEDEEDEEPSACRQHPCGRCCLAWFFDDPSRGMRSRSSVSDSITIVGPNASPLLSPSERNRQIERSQSKRMKRANSSRMFVGKFGASVFVAPPRKPVRAIVPPRDTRNAYLNRLGIGQHHHHHHQLPSQIEDAPSQIADKHASPIKPLGFPFNNRSGSPSVSRPLRQAAEPTKAPLSSGLKRVNSGTSLSSRFLNPSAFASPQLTSSTPALTIDASQPPLAHP